MHKRGTKWDLSMGLSNINVLNRKIQTREEEWEPEAVTAVLWIGDHTGLSVHLPALRMVLPGVAKTCKGSPLPPGQCRHNGRVASFPKLDGNKQTHF